MDFKVASKKRPNKKKAVEFAPNLAIDKIIKFFNNARDAEDISSVIGDDPTFGNSNGAYGIRKSTAANILKERENLPGGKFTELKQIDMVRGVGTDTLNDIFYSFYSDIIRQKSNSNKNSVVVDFIFEEGLLYIMIQNMGELLLSNVSVTFDKKILGISNEKNISDMQIFKNISTLPPKKTFKIFVDVFSSYLKNKQPLLVSSKISYQNNGGTFEYSIKHDLRIYQNYVYIPSSDVKH